MTPIRHRPRQHPGQDSQADQDRRARAGYVYLHSAVDGHTRLAYIEPHDDEKGDTVAGLLAWAAGFFADQGIHRITHVVTDNGPCHRPADFAAAVKAVVARP